MPGVDNGVLRSVQQGADRSVLLMAAQRDHPAVPLVHLPATEAILDDVLVGPEDLRDDGADYDRVGSVQAYLREQP